MLFLFSNHAIKHHTGQGHPEQPLRILVIKDALEKAKLMQAANTLAPRMATKEEILLCHSSDYYDLVQREIAALKETGTLAYLSTGDAVISADSWDVALEAVGAVLVAVDQVMQAKSAQAFCIVRPPGHHACHARGMGFCIFNNVAIGARYVQKKYGLKRVLIVDFDVHHGNGTQEIFYSDPSVFYFSTHEKGSYPQTGVDKEKGDGPGINTTLNCAIPSSPQARNEVLACFQNTLRKAMEAFRPECVFISAGFDAHEQDPLGHFNLTDQDFFTLSTIIKSIANTYCEGRVISVLEGGYNLKALQTASVAHVQGLMA